MEVTAGLAESNGSLLSGIWCDSLHVTCGLTACTLGSAPGPTLGNEYGKTLPFYMNRTHCAFSALTLLVGRQEEHSACKTESYEVLVLDHMQTIRSSLQTDNHTNTSSLTQFLQAGCSLPNTQPTVPARRQYTCNETCHISLSPAL